MNLFRSEEHVGQWALFDSMSGAGVRPVGDFVTQLFGLPRYRERLAPDYLIRVQEHSRELPAALERLGRSDPFWRLSPPR